MWLRASRACFSALAPDRWDRTALVARGRVFARQFLMGQQVGKEEGE